MWSELSEFLSEGLLRTSLMVSASGIVAWTLWRFLRPVSSTLQRALCLFVLVQGVLLWRLPVNVPYSTSTNLVLPGTAPNVSPLNVRTSASGSLADDLQYVRTNTGTISFTPPQPHSTLVNWRTGFLLVWMLGAILTLAVHALARFRFLRQLALRTVERREWQDEWIEVTADLRISAHVELQLTDEAGPCVCRLLKRTAVVVPEDLWRSLTSGERRAVLRHELTHVQRGDLWKALAVRLLAWPQWFNPFAWWAVRRFDEAGEWACDRAAINNRDVTAPGFANLLLRIAGPAAAGIPNMARRRAGEINRRIAHLLGQFDCSDSRPKRASVMLAAIVLIAAGGVRVEFMAKAQEVRNTENVTQSSADILSAGAPQQERREVTGETSDAGPVDLPELISGMLARHKAVSSGQFDYSVKIGVEGTEKDSDGGYFVLSGLDWRVNHKYGLDRINCLDRINYNGTFVSINRSPQQNGDIHTQVHIEESRSVGERNPRPPYFAGTFWYDETAKYILEHQQEANLLRQGVVDGIQVSVIEWRIPADERYDAFGFSSHLLRDGGLLRLFVAPGLGFVLPRIEYRASDGRLGIEFYARDFVRLSAEISIPRRCGYASYNSSGRKYVNDYEITLMADVNAPIPDELFIAVIPSGSLVVDKRGDKAKRIWSRNLVAGLPGELTDQFAPREQAR